MKHIKVKKLWHGFVSIRDYLVEEASKNGEDIEVSVGNERMLILRADFPKGKINNFIIQSKHEDKQYRLVDFVWKPTQKQESFL